MTSPTNPERIDLRDGYYLIRVSKYSFGLMLNGQQHGTIKDYYAPTLTAAMQPAQPSADAVECARRIHNTDNVVFIGSGDEGEIDGVVLAVAAHIQQYGDVRVAEWRDHDELELRHFEGVIKGLDAAISQLEATISKANIPALRARVAELTQRNAELMAFVRKVDCQPVWVDPQGAGWDGFQKRYNNLLSLAEKILLESGEVSAAGNTLASQGGNERQG